MFNTIASPESFSCTVGEFSQKKSLISCAKFKLYPVGDDQRFLSKGMKLSDLWIQRMCNSNTGKRGKRGGKKGGRSHETN